MHSSKCQHGGNRIFAGPELSRRGFVRLAGTGIVTSWFLPVANAFERSALGVETLNVAKNVIYISLSGAPSHIDTFDLKEGPWTPPDFKPTSYGEVRWPQGLMPKTAEHLDKIAIVRSCLAWAAVHDIAMLWAQIARNPISALGALAPHIGSVIALELESRRDPQRDVLPSFLSFRAPGTTVLRGGGYFASRYAPFSMQQPKPEGLPLFRHPSGNDRFARRWNILKTLETNAAYGKDASDATEFYRQARQLVESPEINALFTYDEGERLRYSTTVNDYTDYGTMFLLAYKVLAGRRGARFIHISGLTWDHHADIYAKDFGSISLYTEAKRLDDALGALLTDLASTPGETEGKTLLDETLVVVGGEFGRTVGALNSTRGRDHHLRHSLLFAGAGVKGGRAIGVTDAQGDKLVSTGWGDSATHETRNEDIAATIYSALGIDYTTLRRDDPLKRGFEYVPFAKDGLYKPIHELFG
jgi:hypothetical protein